MYDWENKIIPDAQDRSRGTSLSNHLVRFGIDLYTRILFEFVELCIDGERIREPQQGFVGTVFVG